MGAQEGSKKIDFLTKIKDNGYANFRKQLTVNYLHIYIFILAIKGVRKWTKYVHK